MSINTVETKRKILHMVFGILIVLLLAFGIVNVWHIFILIIISIIVSFFSQRHKIPVLNIILYNFERENDIKKFPGKGPIFYLIGIFLVLSFFPLSIALPSILILALGDSVGHFFGARQRRKIPHFKKQSSNKKFLEGFIAGIVAGFFAALIFVPWYEALAASLVAMIVERIEIKIGAEEVDDNILIPLAAAIAIWITRVLL